MNVAHDRLAVAGIRRLRQSPQPCSAVNPSSDRSRGAKCVGRGAPREPLCWHQQCPQTAHTGTNYSQRSSVTRFIAISRTPEQPSCCRISANARRRKACIESGVLEGSGSLSVIPPQSSPCQRSLVECRQKLPLCILARSAGSCARMGCDASSP